MILDHEHKKTDGSKWVEILVNGVWTPACATDLRILDNNQNLVRVTEIRVRKFKKGE